MIKVENKVIIISFFYKEKLLRLSQRRGIQKKSEFPHKEVQPRSTHFHNSSFLPSGLTQITRKHFASRAFQLFLRKRSISSNSALCLRRFTPEQPISGGRGTLVPTAADWRAEKKGTLKEPVATRLVCKLADIVVRYAAGSVYIRARTRRYTSRVKGKNRKGVRPWKEGRRR